MGIILGNSSSLWKAVSVYLGPVDIPELLCLNNAPIVGSSIPDAFAEFFQT